MGGGDNSPHPGRCEGFVSANRHGKRLIKKKPPPTQATNFISYSTPSSEFSIRLVKRYIRMRQMSSDRRRLYIKKNALFSRAFRSRGLEKKQTREYDDYISICR